MDQVNFKENKINNEHSYLIEYFNECRSGNIVIGVELMTELQNLIDDLDNPDYYYDTFDSEFRIEFIENFVKHTKSPFYGKPFILELWEKALIEAFYSFKWTGTGFRRFKYCLLLIARKNGKSTLCAALSLTELNINIGGIDIVISSNDDKQANIIFLEIENMRKQFDPKGKRSHKNLSGIYNTRNSSTITKLSEKTQNKEGRNINYAYIDETHEMKDNVIAKSIEQSTSTKDEPGIWEITTEGFTNDGYLDKQLKYARKIINGVIDDPTFLPWLYTQDSETEIWQDEATWAKSNPNLGITKKVTYIKDQVRKAQHDKTDRVFMLSKDFNMKMNDAEAWLMEDEYVCEDTFNLEEFRGTIGIGGTDLSETTDLTCSKVMLMKPGSSKKYFITKYFIPEAKVEKGEEEDKKNYLEWAKQGLITITPGLENDFSLITKWHIELYRTWGIKTYKHGYDNALAKYWVTEMEDVGFDMERINMDKRILSSPMKLLAEDLKHKNINYNNNEIDKWCLGNTAFTIDGLGQIMPIKVKDLKNRRIDGTLAFIICEATYLRYREEYLNLVR